MTTPSGTVGLPLLYLANMLVDSTTFRALVGALEGPTGDAQAAAHIHYFALPAPDSRRDYTREELESYRPFALLSLPDADGWSAKRDGRGGALDYGTDGRVVLEVVCSVDALIETPGNANAISEAALDFTGTLGELIEDLLGMAGEASYLDIAEISISKGPYRNDPKYTAVLGSFVGAELTITYSGIVA